MPHVKLEHVDAQRLRALAHAARMKEFGQVLQEPPTLLEISSIATELITAREGAEMTKAFIDRQLLGLPGPTGPACEGVKASQ